jgi:hypothetical protein
MRVQSFLLFIFFIFFGFLLLLSLFFAFIASGISLSFTKHTTDTPAVIIFAFDYFGIFPDADCRASAMPHAMTSTRRYFAADAGRLLFAPRRRLRMLIIFSQLS